MAAGPSRMSSPQEVIPMARRIATADRVDRPQLLDFLRPRHHAILVTTRADGRPQLSPVTCGVDGEGRIVVSTYPRRAKARNARRDPRVSVCVLSDDFDGPYVQVDGHAEVLDLPDALEPLVEYFRSISGEHPDWDEYRDAMRRQGKSLIRVTIERWGPIATGGFPPELAEQ
ncbi:PPOX class F420-dependent enzyme [Gandjariella thermophila]|uniref:PPOX class F420-dependent enzyme n=2 Tax=Gandjariella thermophila TaxID=1931992 RepID=A0A4D4J085_9PSEU|nr:PPOX class F420-dependent enzyme [Gandjariella thermophila]